MSLRDRLDGYGENAQLNYLLISKLTLHAEPHGKADMRGWPYN